jgi:hypothetical protein
VRFHPHGLSRQNLETSRDRFEIYDYAYVVCLAERRKRPLIDGFLKVAKKTRPN